ncbi:MAG: hypothetical protein ACREBS_00420 [Nitrososphaerales archaeon]
MAREMTSTVSLGNTQVSAPKQTHRWLSVLAISVAYLTNAYVGFRMFAWSTSTSHYMLPLSIAVSEWFFSWALVYFAGRRSWLFGWILAVVTILLAFGAIFLILAIGALSDA